MEQYVPGPESTDLDVRVERVGACIVVFDSVFQGIPLFADLGGQLYNRPPTFISLCAEEIVTRTRTLGGIRLVVGSLESSARRSRVEGQGAFGKARRPGDGDEPSWNGQADTGSGCEGQIGGGAAGIFRCSRTRRTTRGSVRKAITVMRPRTWHRGARRRRRLGSPSQGSAVDGFGLGRCGILLGIVSRSRGTTPSGRGGGGGGGK
jgi:hypothetical protein